jgi:hypothetical protein
MTYLAIYLIVLGIVLWANYRFHSAIDPLEPEGKAREIEA